MIELIFKILVKLRGILNPIKVPKSEKWEELSKLTMIEFSSFLSQFKYTPDPLGGLLDYTASVDHFLDESITEGRDCDDWARMWTLWGITNGYKATEIVITCIDKPFRKAHVVTMLYSGYSYILCNYEPTSRASTFTDALEPLLTNKTYLSNNMWAIELECEPTGPKG